MWARSCAVVAALATAAVQADVLNSMSSSKLQSKTYMSMDVWAVSRLLNKEGMIGSGTSEGIGDVGILYRINSHQTLMDFTKVDSQLPKDYVALLSQQMLGKSGTFDTLKGVKKLRGVLIYNDTSTAPAKFSAGDKYPNADCGIKPGEDSRGQREVIWNPKGGGQVMSNSSSSSSKGMHWTDLGVSMFWLQDHSYKALLSRWEDQSSYLWNQDPTAKKPNYPVAAISLNFFMWGAPDAATCLRRKYCDAIGGQNVLGFLRPYKGKSEDVVMVAAAGDAAALFNDLSFGADASAAAIATTIAAAELVGKTVPTEDRENPSKFMNIMFTLFAGEHYGYIGSSSMGNRIATTAAMPSQSSNMEGKHIQYYLELDQLISEPPNGANTFYMHTDSDGTNSAKTGKITDALKKSATEHSLTFEATTNAAEMPPSSYRGLFNEIQDARKNVGAVVVANYDAQYNTDVFETQGDNGNTYNINISQSTDPTIQRIAKLAQVVAETALAVACKEAEYASKYYGKLTADVDFVQSLMHQLMFDGSHAVKDEDGKGAGSEDYNCLGEPGCKQTKAYPMNRYVNPFIAGEMSLSDRMLYYYLSYALRNRDPEWNYNYTVGTKDGSWDRNNATQVCLGQDRGDNKGWSKKRSGVLYPYSAGQTGETAKYCTRKAKKGKEDDGPLACMANGLSGGADYETISGYYEGSATWNWVALPPVDDEKCNLPDWKPGDDDTPWYEGCTVQCVYTPASWIDAPSPAFSPPEYNKLVHDTRRWSTWTESTWGGDAEARIFLVADPATDTWTFVGGLVYCIFSFVFVYFGAKKVESADDGTMFDGEQ